MNHGFRLGRIFGIEIDIDPSWLLIFILITWELAVGIFPAIHPDWSPLFSWMVGIVASILFFASVLAHEIAHSLVAKARGLNVSRIVLFLFGGVSNIDREPPSPRTELLMAIVGPVTSIAIGIFFLLLGGITSGTFVAALSSPETVLSRLNPLSTLLLWLGPINILVGLFNLIPGFPLDGGRVLRSIIWAATGSLERSTRWATLVGQGIGWLFIVAGIAMIFGIRIPLFGTGLINGLWLAFIGWFLNQAASLSYQRVVVEDVLENVPISEVMRSDVLTVPPGISVSKLVYDYLMRTEERAFPVTEDGRLEGLVCLEDIRKVPSNMWGEERVAQIMTPADQLDVVTPKEDVANAFNKMTSQDVGQVPVVQNGQLVGMLNRRDILLWLQAHSQRVNGVSWRNDLGS